MSHIDEGELTAYADGAWAPDDADAQRIRAHLAVCENCRHRLEKELSYGARAAEILAMAAPAQIEVPALPSRKTIAWMPIAWVASIALAIGMGWWSHDVTVKDAVTPAPKVAAPIAAAPAAASRVDTVIVKVPVRAEASRADAPPPQAPTIAAALEAREAMMQLDTTHVIPGLEVVSQRHVDGRLFTEQRLPDGTIVTVMQEGSTVSAPPPAASNLAADAVTGASAGVAAQRKALEIRVPEIVVMKGAMMLRLRAALSVDSLRALAARIR